MCDISRQRKELVDESSHIVLGLQIPVSPGVYMCNVEHRMDTVDLVHDLPDLVQGTELTELSHGLHSEGDIFDPFVVQKVLALPQPVYDVG